MSNIIELSASDLGMPSPAFDTLRELVTYRLELDSGEFVGFVRMEADQHGHRRISAILPTSTAASLLFDTETPLFLVPRHDESVLLISDTSSTDPSRTIRVYPSKTDQA